MISSLFRYVINNSHIYYILIIGTESLASNTRRNVQRVFASTGRSSNDINLSSFLPKSFANPFQRIEETQGYAYPASNGLTEIDRYINIVISEKILIALICDLNIMEIYLQI